MPTDNAPSFRTEAFYAAIAELAQFPEAHEAVLKKLETGVQAIKSQPKSSGNSTALKGWQENLVAFSRGKRLAPAPAAAKVPEEPKPDLSTIMGQVAALASSQAKEKDLDDATVANIKAMVDDTVLADSAKSRRRSQATVNLANKLGETLEGLAKENSLKFFGELGQPDPFKNLDAGPKLVSPFDLVPDGEGDDFTPGRLLLFVTSFNVFVNGVFVKRDYRINGKPAVQNHPDIVRIDGNLKIRSSKKVVNGQEFAFYAKAFWVKEGDAIYGYLNFNQEKEDRKELGRHFTIVGGKLIPRVLG
jgi:hypothetical protein